MVKRIDRIDRLTKDAAVPPNLLNIPSSERSHSKESSLNDEVIVSLADAYENKRARQVNEWEKGQHVSGRF